MDRENIPVQLQVFVFQAFFEKAGQEYEVYPFFPEHGGDVGANDTAFGGANYGDVTRRNPFCQEVLNLGRNIHGIGLNLGAFFPCLTYDNESFLGQFFKDEFVFIVSVFFTFGADSSLFDDQAVQIKEIPFCAVGIGWYVLKDIGIHSWRLRLLIGKIHVTTLWFLFVSTLVDLLAHMSTTLMFGEKMASSMRMDGKLMHLPRLFGRAHPFL